MNTFLLSLTAIIFYSRKWGCSSHRPAWAAWNPLLGIDALTSDSASRIFTQVLGGFCNLCWALCYFCTWAS